LEDILSFIAARVCNNTTSGHSVEHFRAIVAVLKSPEMMECKSYIRAASAVISQSVRLYQSSLLSSSSILLMYISSLFFNAIVVVVVGFRVSFSFFFQGDLYLTAECRVELGRGYSLSTLLNCPPLIFLLCVSLQNTNDNNNNIGIKESKRQISQIYIVCITAGDYTE
jgi:hypothetical protein